MQEKANKMQDKIDQANKEQPQEMQVDPTQSIQTQIAKARSTIQDRLDSSGYDITSDMLERKADITFGQLIKILPILASDISRKKIIAYHIENKPTGLDHKESLNILSEGTHSTSARAQVSINDRLIDCLIDCGASRCIMDRQTKDRLNLEIDASSTTRFVLGDTSTVASLGLIYDVPIKVGSLVIPITVEVLEKTPLPLIIGNNWLQKAKATVDFDLTKLKVEYRKKRDQTPIYIERISEPIPLTTQQNLLDYLKPEHDEEDDGDDNDFSVEGSTSSSSTASATDLVEIQDLDTFHTPVVLNNSLLVMEEDGSVSCKSQRGITIPEHSSHSLKLNVPKSKKNRIIEIKSDFEQYLYLDHVFLRANEGKVHKRIFNHSHEEINLSETFATIEEILDDEIQGYEFLNTFEDIPNLDDEPKPGTKAIAENKLDMFPKCEQDVPPDIVSKLHKLLNAYEDIFDWEDGTPTKATNITAHEIVTEDHSPIRTRPYRISPEESHHLKAELAKYCRLGIIRPSKSPWASPIILVKKPDGSYRLVVNYKKLNAITKKDSYPLPRIDDILDSLGNSKIFSSLDMRNAFFQIPMRDDDDGGGAGSSSVEKSCFCTKFGSFEMVRMGQGLCNSPSTFQRMIDICFQSIMYKLVVSYLDDLFCYSHSESDHLKDLEKVFHCIRKANLSLNPKKCHFFKKSLKFLGYIVSDEGISTDPAKIEKIRDFGRPKSVTQIKSFLGITGYYRKWVPGYAAKARPLYDLTKHDSIGTWTKEAQKSFETLKAALISAPLLIRPDFDKEFILMVDTSRIGVGAVLSQLDEKGNERVVLYLSRALKGSEVNYGVTKLECMGLVWAVQELRPYLLGSKFTIITDHSSTAGILNTNEPTGIIARWIGIMSNYTYEIKYRPGKLLKNADFLSRTGN